NYATFFAVSVNCGFWVSAPKWLTIIRHCRTLFSQARSSEPQAFVRGMLEPGTCMLGKTMSITVQLVGEGGLSPSHSDSRLSLQNRKSKIANDPGSRRG